MTNLLHCPFSITDYEVAHFLELLAMNQFRVIIKLALSYFLVKWFFNHFKNSKQMKSLRVWMFFDVAHPKSIFREAKQNIFFCCFWSCYQKLQYFCLQIVGKISIENQMVSDEYWAASSFIVALVAEDYITRGVRTIKISVSSAVFWDPWRVSPHVSLFDVPSMWPILDSFSTKFFM